MSHIGSDWCVNCHEPLDQHIEGSCVFAFSRFKPMTTEEYIRRIEPEIEIIDPDTDDVFYELYEDNIYRFHEDALRAQLHRLGYHVFAEEYA